VISLSDVFYRYPGRDRGWDLEGITFSIGRGECVLICGGSGSGKSTLAYLFNGLIPHFWGGTLKGTVRVAGKDTGRMSVARFLPLAGMVLQNTDAHLFCSTVEEEMAFGLESLGLPPAEIEVRIRHTAEILHIQELLRRSPLALSGGERRIAAIGSVLCLDPPLLVLDEPFAHLDWAGIEQVLSVLRDLHRRGRTIVVIEHRVSGLLPLATRCIFLEKGKAVADCGPSEARSILKERHLLPAYPPRNTGRRSPGPAFSVQGLSLEMEGRPVLGDISFEVREGEVLAIVGRNGSGKTTLIRHLNGLRLPGGGRVSVLGSDLRGRSPAEIASRIGISFQNPNDQFFKTSVREELAAGGKGPRADLGRVRELCDLFQLHDLLDRPPYRLSEGEKRRVAVGSIAAMDPRILVIDEPTVGQDGRFLEILARIVAALRDRGHTVVIVTHDLEFALAASDRWIVLHEGRIAAEGRPEELIRDDRLIALGAIAPEIPPCPPFTKGGKGKAGIERDLFIKQKENRFLKHLDPRTKIILGAVAIAFVLFTQAPEVHCLESMALFAVMGAMGMLRPWGRSLRLMGPMVVLVFAVSLISTDLRTAVFLALRLFNLFTVSLVFFRTMSPEEMGDGMRKLGLPYELSFMLSTSMRYVPLIARRVRLIREAQMSRGIDLRMRLRNLPNFAALLMPLLVQSFLFSEELAMAMEARGFGLKGRSFRRSYRITLREVLLILASAALLAAFLWFPDLSAWVTVSQVPSHISSN
jgi:energy-coupling factor transport system ATP-binding protein